MSALDALLWARPGPGWLAHAIARQARWAASRGWVWGRTVCGETFVGPEVVDVFADRCKKCERSAACNVKVTTT